MHLYFHFRFVTFVTPKDYTMDKRLQQFLDAENISQAQLADTLGVARAGISHILSGRNKPGFDFLEAMAVHYPQVSMDWLLTGKGRMYKDRRESRICGSAGSAPRFQDSRLL